MERSTLRRERYISGRDAAQVFELAGWKLARRVGSHMMMTKAGERATLSVPDHDELAVGTLRKLIRLAGLTVEEFDKFKNP